MPSRKKESSAKLKRLFKRVSAACGKAPSFKGKTVVFGAGAAAAALMVVGEAPGRTEVREQKPFVGRSGAFLTLVLEEVFKKKRDEFYITNVVKVWPTIDTKRLKTRKPSRAEEEFFLPYLYEEVRIVKPKVILAVGRTAFSALMPEEEFKRGVWFEGPEGTPLMAVYHPSYILRKQKNLGENTEDMKAALRKVKSAISRRGKMGSPPL